jgi:hypothetical protein
MITTTTVVVAIATIGNFGICTLSCIINYLLTRRYLDALQQPTRESLPLPFEEHDVPPPHQFTHNGHHDTDRVPYLNGAMR